MWIYELKSQKVELIPYESGEPLRNVVNHFAECIEQGKEPVTGLELMLKVMRTSQRILEWKE